MLKVREVFAQSQNNLLKVPQKLRNYIKVFWSQSVHRRSHCTVDNHADIISPELKKVFIQNPQKEWNGSVPRHSSGLTKCNSDTGVEIFSPKPQKRFNHSPAKKLNFLKPFYPKVFLWTSRLTFLQHCRKSFAQIPLNFGDKPTKTINFIKFFVRNWSSG